MLSRFKPLQFVFGIAALGIGLAGQLLLRSGYTWLAIILFLIAVGLFIFALRKQPGPEPVLGSSEIEKLERSSWVSYSTGGIAIIFAALAFWMFTSSIPPIYPWLLHLASIGLLIVASLRLDRGKRTGEKQSVPWTWVELVASSGDLRYRGFHASVPFRSDPIRHLVR